MHNKNLDIETTQLELSARVINALLTHDIKTVGDLVQKTESEILRIPNLHRKSLNELKSVLEPMKLYFGMQLDVEKKEEEEQPNIFDDLNRSFVKSSMEAFTKTYQAIMDLNKNDTVHYDDMVKAFEQHKKVSNSFEQSYKDLFN